MAAAAGTSSSAIWRIPTPSTERIWPNSLRDASRLSCGNTTVATATENIPCGSM